MRKRMNKRVREREKERIRWRESTNLQDNTRFLQQIRHQIGSHNLPGIVEVNLNEFTESRGVVVIDSLRIPESFQNRRGLQNSLLNCKEILNECVCVRERKE
jgi:hypothetical protein